MTTAKLPTMTITMATPRQTIGTGLRIELVLYPCETKGDRSDDGAANHARDPLTAAFGRLRFGFFVVVHSGFEDFDTAAEPRLLEGADEFPVDLLEHLALLILALVYGLEFAIECALTHPIAPSVAE